LSWSHIKEVIYIEDPLKREFYIGMYDFQMVEDVNIACEILGGDLKRERPWRG